MELYAVVMTTTTEPSCIFLGGPCSSRRANGDTVMLKNDGNKRMGTNRSNASSTGSGVLPARYDTLQSDMCIVTRDARKARLERKWEGETTTAEWFARWRDADMAEAQGSAHGGRGLIWPNDDVDGSGMEVIGSVNRLISSVVRSAIREEALAFMAERCPA
uniref:Uncharacterized protein n=1 Tax=Oryza barthii TaxID=65489 RepID=A0A0D3GRG1_9ORYZ